MSAPSVFIEDWLRKRQDCQVSPWESPCYVTNYSVHSLLHIPRKFSKNLSTCNVGTNAGLGSLLKWSSHRFITSNRCTLHFNNSMHKPDMIQKARPARVPSRRCNYPRAELRTRVQIHTVKHRVYLVEYYAPPWAS